VLRIQKYIQINQKKQIIKEVEKPQCHAGLPEEQWAKDREQAFLLDSKFQKKYIIKNSFFIQHW
jgi:hypothetical protein